MPDGASVLLVFEVSGRAFAFPLEEIRRVVPIAQLARPPGLPSALEGVLNLGGTAVSVVRLDRLLEFEPRDPGLYSAVIVLKNAGADSGAFAVLADRVKELLPVPEDGLLAVAKEESFHGCAAAAVSVGGRYIHVLSPARLLLEQEAAALAEFQARAQQRLQYWEAGTP